MNVLGTYLWKEWREQRAALGFLALGLTVVTAILVLGINPRSWQLTVSYDWIVGVSLGGVLFTVGSDLLPRDLRHEPRQFLERVPAGLRGAFAAKLVFFFAAMLAAGLFGILLAATIAWIRTGAIPTRFYALPNPEQCLLIGVGILCWVLAVSAWVSTSALAIPATAIFLAVCTWPWWVLVRELDSFRLGSTTSNSLILVVAAGGVVTACWSFVVGAARSRKRRTLVLGGMGIAAICFLPAWTLAGTRYVEWKNASFCLVDARVGLGGRHAFVVINRREPYDRRWRPRPLSRPTALLLDLEDGDWSLVGRLDGSVFRRGTSHSNLWDPRGLEDSRCVAVYDVRAEQEVAVLDSDTGKPIAPGADSAAPWPGASAADFGLGELPASSRVRWAGLGYVLRSKDTPEDPIVRWRDPASELIADLKTLLPGVKDYRFPFVYVLPERWLIRQAGTWVWYDPRSGDRQACEWLGKEDRIEATLEDGSLLVCRNGELVRFHPRSGERRVVRFLGEGSRSVLPLTNSSLFPGRPIPSDSCSVVRFQSGGLIRLALLDPIANELKLTRITLNYKDDEARTTLLSSDGPQAVLLNSRQITRLDLAAGTREVILDVTKLDESELRARSVAR